MANILEDKEEMVPPMGTTDLTGLGTFFKKYTPGIDTEGYAAYKSNLPEGVFEKTESEWVDDSFQAQLRDRYSQYLESGGSKKLSFEDFSNNTSTNFLRPDGVNDRVINQNVLNSAMGEANEASEAAGGGTVNQNQFTKAVQNGQTVVPGYNTDIGTPNVPVIGAPVSNSLQNSTNSGIIPGSPQDNGLNDKSSLDTKTGAVTDAEGNTVTLPGDPNASGKDVLSIFDKASNLFGDTFDAKELRRMALYTVGGLITGGSTSGSFKWAAMQVMNESAEASKNAATLGAASLKNKPVQVKVAGENKPVQALWDGKQYYNASTGVVLENAKKWVESSHSPSGLAATYTSLVEGLKTGRLDNNGDALQVGENAILSYNKFRAKVAQWELQGYKPDLDSPVIQNSFVEAVKASIEANKGKSFDNDELTTPESFFDMLLVKGVVSSAAGDTSIFKDNKGNVLSTDANNKLMLIINNAVQTGQAAGYNSSVASATFNIHEAWKGLGKEKQKQYNESADKGESGFIVFAESLK